MFIPWRTSTAAAGFWDGSLELWNVKQGKMQELIGPQHGMLKCVAFSTDGTMLATGSNDGDMILWSTADGKQQKVFGAHQRAADRIAFSHDDMRVASANLKIPLELGDGLIKVWDISGISARVSWNRRYFIAA
jgi:WD40 repeat protein